MALYYKFRSEKDYNSIPWHSPFISVAKLKEKIFQSKQLDKGKDCYLVVSNAQTNEEYLDEALLIPKNTSVLIRRVPGWLYLTIVRQGLGLDSSGIGIGFGGGMGEWMVGGRGYGLQQKTPPGYVCHRCKVPGHFIQYCPTNGDPNYNLKRVNPPTGTPKSMLIAAADGSCALPTGDVAVLKLNKAAFEKEIEGLRSTCSVSDIPPELRCPLCKDVMKSAVLTSKCCFKSFCDKCIRDYIISKSICVCGAANILADDLIPNQTTRDLISRIMETGTTSAENAGSTFQVQDMEFARYLQPKIPSPTCSALSKGEQKVSPSNEGKTNVQEAADAGKALSASQKMLKEAKATRAADVSEATHKSTSVKEPASQGSTQLVVEEVQQKLAPCDAAKKNKKEKACLPANGSLVRK